MRWSASSFFIDSNENLYTTTIIILFIIIIILFCRYIGRLTLSSIRHSIIIIIHNLIYYYQKQRHQPVPDEELLSSNSKKSPTARLPRLPSWKNTNRDRFRRVQFLMANLDTLLVYPSLKPTTEAFLLDPTRKDQSVANFSCYKNEQNIPSKSKSS